MHVYSTTHRRPGVWKPPGPRVPQSDSSRPTTALFLWSLRRARTLPHRASLAAILLYLSPELSFQPHRDPLYHLSFLHTAPALPGSWPTRRPQLSLRLQMYLAHGYIPRVNLKPHPSTNTLPIWTGEIYHVLVQGVFLACPYSDRTHDAFIDPTLSPCISYRTHNSRICGVQGNAAARAKLASSPYACRAVHQAKTSPHELPSILAPPPSRSRVQVRTAGKSFRLLVRIAPACADMRFTNILALISAIYAKTQSNHIGAHLSASPTAAYAGIYRRSRRRCHAALSTVRTSRCAGV